MIKEEKKLLDTKFSAIFIRKKISTFPGKRCFSLFHRFLLHFLLRVNSFSIEWLTTNAIDNKLYLLSIQKPNNLNFFYWSFFSEIPILKTFLSFHALQNSNEWGTRTGGKKIFLSLFQKEEIHRVCECRIRDSACFVITHKHTSALAHSQANVRKNVVHEWNAFCYAERWLQFR